jgi:polar amino acid transport system substrate-binding protein
VQKPFLFLLCLQSFLMWILLPPAVSFSDDLHQDLIYMAEENKPFVFKDEDTLKGITVDILRLIWEDLSIPEQKIRLYSWARAYKNLIDTERSVLLGIAKTPERENVCKWVGPFAKLRFGVFALKSSQITIDRFEDLNDYVIGTVNKDIVEHLLIQKGFQGKQESVSNNIHNLQKLEAQRINLVGSFEVSFYETAKKAGLNPDDYELVYVLKELGAYLGFHKNTSDALINKFQKSLNQNLEKVQVIINSYLK